MLTISKPLSAGQAQAYHKSEFTSAEQSYYTQRDQVRGEWQGELAFKWGLAGEVTEEQFSRLANGQHPETGEQLVRHREPFEYRNQYGDTVKTMEHRAGWDATFSAPKSVSITALVGGDERVREAHRESVRIALDEMEGFVQARIGGNNPAETTGKWVAAKFEHDSARPVEGYSAPQLHTHVVFFNVTETAEGQTHAIQPQELYRSQKYGTAIYQSELAWRLKALGYEIEAGKNHAPEIKGYSQEYLEASSPRSQQIKAHLEEQGLSGAGPAQIAAHRTRDAKAPLSAEETLARHREVAERYGNQADRVVAEARERAQRQEFKASPRYAQEALTWARDKHLEREAVVNERELMRDALKRSMGQARFEEIRDNFEKRVRAGEFIEIDHGRPGTAERSLTTRQMLEYERENIAQMKAGQERFSDPLVLESTVELMHDKFARLSAGQRQAAVEILASEDKIMGLQGTAGAGKTTALNFIREAAARDGYQVEGFAPTSRATQQLEDAGIRSTTLQHHLAQGYKAEDSERHLYFVDESSLASTKQVNEFLHRLHEYDRVIFVGDTRQHQGVEAGRPFEQLQEAGMKTSRLEEIIRQRDPRLKQAVEQLARGEVREAIDNLNRQGRVHEIADREERMRAIARDYAAHPRETLVVSPDNQSRQEINQLIHRELKAGGTVYRQEHSLTVLTPRQDMTGADRQWTAQYQIGDVVRYTKGSRTIGVKAGEYVRVTAVDREQNLLKVERENGEQVTYDPRRLQGVSVYREAQREFSEGERVQFTAPYKSEGIANRELGTIERMDAEGNLQIRFDSGREARFNIREHPHLDYGYAVTSHSSQGATADRVLVHVDTAQAHEKLINSRLAYVSVSRGRYDAQIYTNNAGKLGNELSRDVSKRAALETQHELSASERSRAAAPVQRQEQSQSHGQGYGYGIER